MSCPHQNKADRLILKYLKHYAEVSPSATYVDSSFSAQYFNHVIVIPVYDESFTSIQRLLTRPFNASNLLFILVVNAPEKGDIHAIGRTVKLLSRLSEFKYDSEWGARYSDRKVILLDYCSVGRCLPDKQGVGLARKIGCDLATQLIYDGIVKSSWIHSTDADTDLPVNYFDAPTSVLSSNYSNLSALIYPFEHKAVQGLKQAMQLYDDALRYYVEGLMRAGSPYAFHTIGSLMAIHVNAYVAVRGFPKRNAGEDFYLLNKLAKVGQIKTLSGPVIRIEGRASQRVPFGTGPAISQINALANPAENYLYYHPDIFDLLKLLLDAINAVVKIKIDAISIDNVIDFISENTQITNTISLRIDTVLHTIGFQKVLTQASKQSKNPEGFLKTFHDGFDGFKTLKFIHELRNQFYPSVNKAYLLQHCSWFRELRTV